VSITIEVTGNSIPEVADKLLAIGASLRASGTLSEVAKEAPVDPTLNRPTSDASVTSPDTSSDTPRSLAPKSVPAAEAIESQPTTEEASSTPAPAILDYKTEVAPFVLKLVEVSGKPAAQRVLDQFGVVKASHISPERWPELVAIIKAEMGQ
jgi:hypothetical protein